MQIKTMVSFSVNEKGEEEKDNILVTKYKSGHETEMLEIIDYTKDIYDAGFVQNSIITDTGEEIVTSIIYGN